MLSRGRPLGARVDWRPSRVRLRRIRVWQVLEPSGAERLSDVRMACSSASVSGGKQRGHPLASPLSSQNGSVGGSSRVGSNADCCRSRWALPVVRAPVFNSWLSCPADTLQSPIRIKAAGRLLTIRPWPLVHQHPRKPSVPNRAQFADRPDITVTTVEQIPGLRPRGPRQPLCGSRPGRTRPTMPSPIRRRRACLATLATLWLGAFPSAKANDERPHRPARW